MPYRLYSERQESRFGSGNELEGKQTHIAASESQMLHALHVIAEQVRLEDKSVESLGL